MWSYTFTKEYKDVSASQIWDRWSDIANWPKWDQALEATEANESMRPGLQFKIKPRGGPWVKLEIERCETQKEYLDRTHFPFAVMHGHHVLEKTADGVKLSTTMSIKGPLWRLWKKIVTDGIVSGLEKDTDDLVAYARKF